MTYGQLGLELGVGKHGNCVAQTFPASSIPTCGNITSIFLQELFLPYQCRLGVIKVCWLCDTNWTDQTPGNLGMEQSDIESKNSQFIPTTAPRKDCPKCVQPGAPEWPGSDPHQGTVIHHLLGSCILTCHSFSCAPVSQSCFLLPASHELNL